jgi:hypothetical protein
VRRQNGFTEEYGLVPQISSYIKHILCQTRRRKETAAPPVESPLLLQLLVNTYALQLQESGVVAPAREHGDAAARDVEPRALLPDEPRAPARERRRPAATLARGHCPFAAPLLGQPALVHGRTFPPDL